jgi:hypothetical protein
MGPLVELAQFSANYIIVFECEQRHQSGGFPCAPEHAPCIASGHPLVLIFEVIPRT